MKADLSFLTPPKSPTLWSARLRRAAKAGFASIFRHFGEQWLQIPTNCVSWASGSTKPRQTQAIRATRPPPSQAGIAGRFATELVAGLVVGGGLGWGVDGLFGHFGFHTRPVFLLLFFVLGAAAGIRNVMRAANEINADMSARKE